MHNPLAPKLILAIDDEPEILNIIKECLEMEGFQVLTAPGAKEGIKLYEERGSEIGWFAGLPHAGHDGRPRL